VLPLTLRRMKVGDFDIAVTARKRGLHAWDTPGRGRGTEMVALRALDGQPKSH